MEQEIRATRRDLIGAAVQSIKIIVMESQACHNGSLEAVALIDESDKDNATEEQLKGLLDSIGAVVDGLAAINAETMTALAALVSVERLGSFLTDEKPEEFQTENP